jgi:hypothetical protein
MQCHVVRWKAIDVSEENVAFILVAACFTLVSALAYFCNLKFGGNVLPLNMGDFQ